MNYNSLQHIFLRENISKKIIHLNQDGYVRIKLEGLGLKYVYLMEVTYLSNPKPAYPYISNSNLVNSKLANSKSDIVSKHKRYIWLEDNEHQIHFSKIHRPSDKNFGDFLEDYQERLPKKILDIFLFNLEKLR